MRKDNQYEQNSHRTSSAEKRIFANRYMKELHEANRMGTMVVTRYHDISMGHRVVGHSGKCRHLHGHNYRIHFVCHAKEMDNLGRIIDFGEIKTRLCAWLEAHWDHRMMLWEKDPWLAQLQAVDAESIVVVPFNPTAEAIARYLVCCVAPECLAGTGVTLVSCTVEETAKCSASYSLEPFAHS